VGHVDAGLAVLALGLVVSAQAGRIGAGLAVLALGLVASLQAGHVDAGLVTSAGASWISADRLRSVARTAGVYR
jgi:hypothetical protein